MQKPKRKYCRKSKCGLNNKEIIEKCETFLNGEFIVINKFEEFNKIKGIYGIFNTINGKLYVGKGESKKGIGSRLINHQKDLENNIHFNNRLQNSWNKHGEEVFSFILIENLNNNPSLIIQRETYWINFYKTKNQNFGYNINDPETGRLGIIKNPLTLKIIKDWIIKWEKDYGEPPSYRSGIIPYDNLKRTWNNIAFSLTYGQNGLPGGITLKEIIYNTIGKTHVKKAKCISFSEKEMKFVVLIKNKKIGKFKDLELAKKAFEIAKTMLNNGDTIENVRKFVKINILKKQIKILPKNITFSEQRNFIIRINFKEKYYQIEGFKNQQMAEEALEISKEMISDGKNIENIRKLILLKFLNKQYIKKTLPQGISFSQTNQKFVVYFYINKKRYTIGRFKDQETAEKTLQIVKKMANDGEDIINIRKFIKNFNYINI